ncbi:hypothetical protein FisN_19Lh216 [Fistulifera solaris]|uniref:Prolyl 4-hydroxylase alpha subunit domain-containing protein n=1 Tax=Fistulifera solaris TaxID=1519565 RepID=A0A1Z5J6X5_FISSO|nr:hypothetical protein FisN_19Lh216 [Fistulifera solaris]|eukprot:GAX09747.1 hypothetical protein FisN_19Lh216 [Fistulifera solaris]
MSKATFAVPAEESAHHPHITINDKAPPTEEVITATRISPDHASKRSDKCLRRTPRNTQCIRFPPKTSLCYRRLDQLFFSSTPKRALSSYKKPWEKVHAEPNIYVLENFLTTKEISHLMEFVATKRFQRSFVDGENNISSIDRSHRTSTFLSFAKQHDKTIATIEQRAADLLGTQTRALEGLQLVRYEQGQFFGVHHDLGIYDEEEDTVALPPKTTWSPRRLVTLFCYLNDCSEGGATVFPKAQLRVQPAAGNAVLFSNVMSGGMPDVRTLHAGEPPTSPQCVKYGLNIWFCEEF